MSELIVWIGKKVDEDSIVVDQRIDDQNMCRLIDLFIDFIKENNIVIDEPMKSLTKEELLDGMSQIAGKHSMWEGEAQGE